MFKTDNRVHLLAVLCLVMLAAAWGCSQSDDITAPVSLTNMWLTADRLPTPPVGMVYEFWVSASTVTSISIPAEELVSMGKFSFVSNDTITAFLETNGELRADSNKFVLEGDILEYATAFVSVELLADPSPGTPGPILLMSAVTDLDNALRLVFPFSMGDDGFEFATCRYNLQSVTDDDRLAGRGYGLWFSNYSHRRQNTPDTNDFALTWKWDTLEAVIDSAGDTLNLEQLYAPQLDSISYVRDTVRILFGRDTLTMGIDSFLHARLIQTFHWAIPEPPFIVREAVPSYEAGDTVTHFVSLDVFEQDEFGLPVLDDFGWKYKGWVMTDAIPAVGAFTGPAYRYKDDNGNNMFPGDEGGLLSTGTFSHIDQADDANPFTLDIFDYVVYDTLGNPIDTVYRVPDVPGEDFLNGAALSAATDGAIDSPVDLLAGSGTVFVSIEPNNRLSDSTNFPLVAFAKRLPNSFNVPTDNNTAGDGRITMTNLTHAVPGTSGFPLVVAEYQRQ